MDVSQAALNVGLAVTYFFLVNAIGRGSSGLGYTTFLANLEKNSFGFNSLFRVFAPTALMGFSAIGLYVAGVDALAEGLWLSVLFYWLFRLIYYAMRGWFSLIPRGLFAAQAGISVGIAYYFYTYGISKGLDGILPQPVDVTFQFWLLVLGFAYLWLSQNAPTERLHAAKRANLAARHQGMRQQFSGVLGSRYKQDVVLRGLFYTFMLVEDFNRGTFVRAIERLVAQLGGVKTTGIMQVTADRVLSDQASVLLAQDIVAEIWDDYVAERLPEHLSWIASDPNELVIQAIGPNHYVFSYRAMKDFASRFLSELYLQYSGNRFDDLYDFFEVVFATEEKDIIDSANFTVEVYLPSVDDQARETSDGIVADPESAE